MKTFPKNLQNIVYSLLFPLYCPSCEKHLDNGRGWLCPDCWSSLTRPDKEHLQNARSLKIDRVKVAFQYNDVTRMLVQQMKFNGRIDIAEMIGEKIAQCFRNLVLDYRFKCVVPVPLHPVRIRERGYNQNLIIANSFGRILNLPVYSNLIKRIKNTKPQSRLSNSERMTNLHGAFKPVKKTDKKPSGDVILIDDVIHTGSTAAGCIDALCEAGIKNTLVISAFG